jgi:V-ATPase subunit C
MLCLYSQAAWIHIKLIRGFVESVLRYGLPIDFSTYLVDPVKGKVIAVLAIHI